MQRHLQRHVQQASCGPVDKCAMCATRECARELRRPRHCYARVHGGGLAAGPTVRVGSEEWAIDSAKKVSGRVRHGSVPNAGPGGRESWPAFAYNRHCHLADVGWRRLNDQ